MLSPFYRNMPENRTGFLRHFCPQLFNRNPNNRTNTGILPGNLPPVDADTAKAGGVGHMVIEIAGRPQPPPSGFGFRIEVSAMRLCVGGGRSHPLGNGGEQAVCLLLRKNGHPVNGGSAAGGLVDQLWKVKQ